MERLKLLPMSRATLIMDFVVIALIILLPVLCYSIHAIRYRRNVVKHRRLQTFLGIVLGIAIIAFELDVRINGWRHLAEQSPFYDTLVFPSLFLHLIFAIPTLITWTTVLVSSLRNFRGGNVSQSKIDRHKLLGRLSAIGLFMTSITGWIFFWLAFIAS